MQTNIFIVAESGFVVMNFDRVSGWFPNASDDEMMEIEEWLDEVEYGEDPIELEPADLDELWDRIVVLAGGSMHASLEREVRMLLGELTEIADTASSGHEDSPEPISVRLREHLRSVGKGPSGSWEATLLSDLAENACAAFEVWVHLDPGSAVEQLRSELGAAMEACDRLGAETRSLTTRRILASTTALCSYRLGLSDRAIERTELFFQLEQQARRESGDGASLRELQSVTLAGVNAFASKRDGDGVAEVMRRIRLLIEPAGGMLQPEFVEMWSDAMRDLDPPFAQMLALQLLRDVQATTGEHSDEAMAAAHTLMAATVRVGDAEATQRLVEEWVPLVLDAPLGAGAQIWLESIDLEDPDEP